MLTDTEIDGVVRAIQELREEVAALRKAVESGFKPRKRQARLPLGGPDANEPRVRDFVALWNTRTAGRLPVAMMPRPGSERFKAICAALDNEIGWGDWGAAMEELARSPFHAGENPRGWCATIDFIIHPNQREKWVEGAKWRSTRHSSMTITPHAPVACVKCGGVATVGPGTRSSDLSGVALCAGCFR
jgi:hypothetical protein